MKKKLLTGLAAAAVISSVATPGLSNIPAVKSAKTHTVKADSIQDAFLTKAATQAQKAAKRYGVYPSVMIAQAIVESDWGRSALATEANNLFGIKAGSDWTGATYYAKTREENSAGKSYYITAAFRKYSSYEGSFDDNGQKLRLGVSWQPERYQGAWIENASTYSQATKALTGTYATDHKYNQSLDSRIVQYNLNKYDPTISKTAKSYKVEKDAATYTWPTDHDVTTKSGSVKKGQTVNVDQTITYYNGSKRMHIAGKGWVNSSIFVKNSALPSTQAPKANDVSGDKVNKNLMHNAYVYNGKGQKIAGMKSLKEDNVIATYGTKNIKGKKYYKIGNDQYIAAGNVDGTMRLLKRNTYVYNGSGNRDNSLVYKKGSSLATYGSRVTIVGKKYYKIGINQYVKVANFVK